MLQTANSKTLAGAAVLLASEKHNVTGCAFTIGTKPSPCLTIEWQAGAGSVKVNGEAVLVESSTGMCKSGEGAVQGTAMIVSTQAKVTAQ